MSDYIYGVVAGGIWYSNRMEFPLNGIANGIYSMDMENDDFKSTISVANIDDARKFFSKASKVQLVRGISFHDCIIPENPVKYEKLPLKVQDPTYEEFEEIEIAILKGKLCYFLQVVYGDKSYPLMDVKTAFEEKKTLDGIKGVTPEMRIVFSFHSVERKRKELEKELLEPEKIIKRLMGESGATVSFVKKNNKGFEVQWSVEGYTLNTQLDKNYRVLEAGFCISHWDATQTARSLVNVVKDYKGARLNYTRTTQNTTH